MKELRVKVHNLDQALHACKRNNTYLQEKVRALKKSPKAGKTWYEGQPSHAMYKKQAFERGKASQLTRKRFTYPHKGKYG